MFLNSGGKGAVDVSLAAGSQSPDGQSSVTVVIPTTGNVVSVCDLKSRPRLKTCLVTLEGDYRPLGVSKDYAHLVSGPLSDLISEGPFQLVIDGTLETGRSWELPVLIAHLLHEQGLLQQQGSAEKQPQAADPEVTPPSRRTLVWATGKLDANLSPQADQYHLGLKLERAQSLLDAAKDEGATVVFAVPGSIDQDDIATLEEAAEQYGARVLLLNDINDVRQFVGELGTPQRTHSDKQQSSHGRLLHRAQSTVYKFARNRAVLLPLAGLIVVAIALALSNNFSGSSNNQSTGVFDALVVQRLHADSMERCHEAIYAGGAPMEVETIERADGRFQIRAAPGLCGLRFVNAGSEVINLSLDKGLIDKAIVGNTELFTASGRRLAPTWESIVYFVKQPSPGDYKVALHDGQQHSATLRFVQP